MGRKRIHPKKFLYDATDILYYKGGFYDGYHNELVRVLRRSTPKGKISYKVEFLKDGRVVTIEERFLGFERDLGVMNLEGKIEVEEINID